MAKKTRKQPKESFDFAGFLDKKTPNYTSKKNLKGNGSSSRKRKKKRE